MHLAAVATLVSPSSIAMADTYSDGSWTSGSGDMNAQYAVKASYTVEIPASITLPASGYSTLDDGNVKIHAGAQIPTATSIKVSLSANQHFAAYLGTQQSHNDAVDFMVKMDNQNPLAETTDAVVVLVANAETAHDTGATTNLNVGLAPDQQSKYAGSYVGHVQFTVGTSTASPIVMNEDGTLEFATTVGGGGSARQAFVLSYGDIHTITGVNADSTDTNVLSGGGSWLRSPGPDGSSAGLMGAGTFDYFGSFEYGGEAVRPALWITTN